MPKSAARGGQSRDPRSETMTRVVAAARVCFRDRGVRGTRMGDVADRAGMARQTLYDFVANRGELVELALAARIDELGRTVEATLGEPAGDIGERLVEIIALSVETCRDDDEFVRLTTALDERQAFQYLAGPSPLRRTLEKVIAGALHDARTAGALRDDAEVDEMLGWLQGMMAVLAARQDLDGAALRSLLRRYALPALLVAHGQPATG